MGIPLSRIEREFIFKSLKENGVEITIHGKKWESKSRLIRYTDAEIQCRVTDGDISKILPGEDVEAFFGFQNNHFTFQSKIMLKEENIIFLNIKDDLYKDSNRLYRRIKMHEKLIVSFRLLRQKYELNFPRINKSFPVQPPVYAEDFNPSTIANLIQIFQDKMKVTVSEHRIVMMRDREAETGEEQIMRDVCKIIWIPSTDKDFPARSQFYGNFISGERFLSRLDYIDYREKQNIKGYQIEKKLKDYFFQKKIKGIFSEVYCPIFYTNYLVGYVYACNKDTFKQEITRELVEYIDQFSKVLSYSLKQNGYFKSEPKTVEANIEAPVIDISASGLLFAHSSGILGKELDVYKEFTINFRINDRHIPVDSWLIRKFKDEARSYFGLQFKKMDPADFQYLYEFLYKKPYKPEGKYIW